MPRTTSVQALKKQRLVLKIPHDCPGSLEGTSLEANIQTETENITGSFYVVSDQEEYGRLLLSRIDISEEEAKQPVFYPYDQIRILEVLNRPQPIDYPGLLVAESYV